MANSEVVSDTKIISIVDNNKMTRRARNRVRVFDKSNPAHLYLSSLTANSARTLERALDAVAKLLGYEYMDEMDWNELQRHHVQALMRLLEDQGKSPSTRALYLSAIKGVMKEAWLADMVSVDQYSKIKEIKKPPGSRKRKGQALDILDVAKAIEACNDNSKAGVRDKAILALLLGAGLRRLECAELGFRDVDFGKDELSIIGKGDKERSIPLESEVMDCLLDWVHIRGEWDGPLFCAIRKGKPPAPGQLYGGEINMNGLNDSSIYLVCTTRGMTVDVDCLKPHNLRRTYGTEHDKAGIELSTISDLLGHASLDTTRTYIYDDKDVKKRRAMLKTRLGHHAMSGDSGA
jgi:integrase/recombinase XerD